MKEKSKIKQKVKDRYTDIARSNADGCGCSPSCCAPQASAKELSTRIGYSAEEIDSTPEGANIGLGCGNPQTIAGLKPGETVLDLGCGGGFDCFLAAKKVGNEGRVIGVDMTPEMISRAGENARKSNCSNVEFRLGEIEHLPLPDNSVDVIISNCVINLSPDKPQVFREAYRVLRSAGRLAISDIVATRDMPEDIRHDINKYTGCIAGAASVEELKAILEQSGFVDIQIELNEESRSFIKDWFPGSGAEEFVVSATIEAIK
jgi:SAM-dependent methyltransferase